MGFDSDALPGRWYWRVTLFVDFAVDVLKYSDRCALRIT